jgi:hypothetical protein
MCFGSLVSCKFCDPNGLEKRTKIITAFEQNGLRIKQIRELERSDIIEVLVKWFKQERSDRVPVSDLVSCDNFCSS